MKKYGIFLGLLFLGFLIYQFGLSGPSPRQHTFPVGENIICFGDSLTYGTGASQGQDYPSQLATMISKPVINKGIPGDTTSSALARLDQDVLSQSPQIVLLTLGANDLKNGTPKDVAFRNLKTIIESIQAKGALVIVGGVDIPIWGRGFGEGYVEVCRQTGVTLIPNIFEGIMGNSKLMSDPIHPNDAGYTKMAQKFYRALQSNRR
ncbi:MAG TPA: arylesterase [Syntrophobacteraceae bacterium]|nr:arylesterase [Syntrophobacteraceae bacterium]